MLLAYIQHASSDTSIGALKGIENVHVEVAVVKKKCYIPPNLPLPASSLISPSLDLSVFLSIVVDCWALSIVVGSWILQAGTQLKGQKKKHIDQ